LFRRPFVAKTLCEAKVEMRLNDSPDKFASNLRRPCSRCGKPLMLTRIEPANPGFDLRVYYSLTAGITTPSYRRPQLRDFQSFAACVLFNLPASRPTLYLIP
jgi:hypothetical protein